MLKRLRAKIGAAFWAVRYAIGWSIMAVYQVVAAVVVVCLVF